MKLTKKQSKILGSLIGGALGDTMGSVTETRPHFMLKEKYGWVSEILNPPYDSYSRNQAAGMVTDDFYLAYATAWEMVKAGGAVTDEGVKAALIDWYNHPLYFIPYAGPTSKVAVLKLLGESNDYDDKYAHLVCNNRSSSNGVGMKIGPVGLIHGTDYDNIIEDTIHISNFTHNNPIATAGGAAIACAVGRAMTDGATIDGLVEAGLYGAKEGYDRANLVQRPSAGPSIYKRINLAVEIGLKYSYDQEKAMIEIADIIGTGLPSAEAIPAVFGMIAAAGGDPVDSILLGVNGGNDTDTVATMIGAIVGALHGHEAYKQSDVDLIEKINEFDLTKLALGIDKVSKY